MKNREYFEQLVSSELDGELSLEQRHELDERLNTDPELRAFRDQLLRQRELLQSLPRLSADHVHALRPALVVRIWRARVNLSAPIAAAAAILLFVAGLLMAGRQSSSSQPAQTVTQRANVVLYESERLEPATTQLISTDEVELN